MFHVIKESSYYFCNLKKFLHIVVYFKGESCRTRVLKHLAKKYDTLQEAEEDLGIDYFQDSIYFCSEVPDTPNNVTYHHDSLSPIFKASPISSSTETKHLTGDIVWNFVAAFKSTMSSRLKIQLVNYLYKLFVIESGGMDLFKFIESDFLNISLDAMKTLFFAKKKNLLYSMSKCFERKDPGMQTRMPLDRMPFGLIDYNLQFFD